MSRPVPGPNDPSYPICEQTRDALLSCEQTSRSQHLPRGPAAYYARTDILKVLKKDSQGKTQGENVFSCKCPRCKWQAGVQSGSDYRESHWKPQELFGRFATIYALLIYLRCPGLIHIFRQYNREIDQSYLSEEQLDFLGADECRQLLTSDQAKNIRKEVLRTQYQFLVPKFVQRNEITRLDERETLPIKEDELAAGKGDFGEVFPFNVCSEHLDDNLKSYNTNRFARKIFRKLPDPSKRIKEFVLQQLKSNQYQHPHLMPALAAFQHGEYFFILFEFAESTLYKFLEGGPPSFSSQKLWEQVHGLARGLAYLHGISLEGNQQHSGRMIHRDLKPANVLIVNDVMKIADFGLANYKPWPTEAESRLQAAEQSVYEGINSYSSPPGQEACEKDDVYSLGAMISEIACFDIGKQWEVARYREQRFNDTGGQQTSRSRKFYYYERNIIKDSVTETHARLLKTVQEMDTNPENTLIPWQKFFYQNDLFDMLQNMLHGSKTTRPKAAEVVDMLETFSRRADHYVTLDVSENHNDEMLNGWLDALAISYEAPAKTECRFIARFVKSDHGHIQIDNIARLAEQQCALWVYPNATDGMVTIQRYHVTTDARGSHPREDTEYVDRTHRRPYTGIMPLYIDDSNSFSVELCNSTNSWVYKFHGIADALRFQGILTGETVYNNVSLQLRKFHLINDGKADKKPSPPKASRFSSFTNISRSKKPIEKEEQVGGRAHIQLWSRSPDVRIAIITKDSLIIVKVVGDFDEKAKGLTKITTTHPTMARLAIAQIHTIPLLDGIPLVIEPGKYKKCDEVRLKFETEDDVRTFWDNLNGLQDIYFPTDPPRNSDVSRRNTVASQETAGSHETSRSRETARSAESGPTRRDTAEHRRDTIRTLPINHT